MAAAPVLSSTALARRAAAPTYLRRLSAAVARRSASSSSPSSSSSSSAPNLPYSAPQLPPSFASPVESQRLKPVSPSFYTARPTYTDALLLLQDLERRLRRALRDIDVLHGPALPLTSSTSTGNPDGSSPTPFSTTTTWLKPLDMEDRLGVPLKTSHYRNLVERLDSLANHRALALQHLTSSNTASAVGGTDALRLVRQLERTLAHFSRDAAAAATAAAAASSSSSIGSLSAEGDVEQDLDATDVDPSSLSRQADASVKVGTASSHVDALGRAYARGRRKESSARVWLVPSKPVPTATEDASDGALPTTPTSSLVSRRLASSVLVNNVALGDYFTRLSHAERVLHPLRVVDSLGGFNVFALVRGGGHSGQAGAVAHGVARALEVLHRHWAAEAQADRGGSRYRARVEWARADEVREALAVDGVLTRDPRMVERKKTGLAKARKAYTWVKR